MTACIFVSKSTQIYLCWTQVEVQQQLYLCIYVVTMCDGEQRSHFKVANIGTVLSTDLWSSPVHCPFSS